MTASKADQSESEVVIGVVGVRNLWRVHLSADSQGDDWQVEVPVRGSVAPCRCLRFIVWFYHFLAPGEDDHRDGGK